MLARTRSFYSAFYEWSLSTSTSHCTPSPVHRRTLHDVRKHALNVPLGAGNRRRAAERSSQRATNLKKYRHYASAYETRRLDLGGHTPHEDHSWQDAPVQSTTEKPFDTLQPWEEVIRYNSFAGIMLQTAVPSQALDTLFRRHGRPDQLKDNYGVNVEIGQAGSKVQDDGTVVQLRSVLVSGMHDEVKPFRSALRSIRDGASMPDQIEPSNRSPHQGIDQDITAHSKYKYYEHYPEGDLLPHFNVDDEVVHVSERPGEDLPLWHFVTRQRGKRNTSSRAIEGVVPTDEWNDLKPILNLEHFGRAMNYEVKESEMERHRFLPIQCTRIRLYGPSKFASVVMRYMGNGRRTLREKYQFFVQASESVPEQKSISSGASNNGPDQRKTPSKKFSGKLPSTAEPILEPPPQPSHLYTVFGVDVRPAPLYKFHSFPDTKVQTHQISDWDVVVRDVSYRSEDLNIMRVEMPVPTAQWSAILGGTIEQQWSGKKDRDENFVSWPQTQGTAVSSSPTRQLVTISGTKHYINYVLRSIFYEREYLRLDRSYRPYQLEIHDEIKIVQRPFSQLRPYETVVRKYNANDTVDVEAAVPSKEWHEMLRLSRNPGKVEEYFWEKQPIAMMNGLTVTKSDVAGIYRLRMSGKKSVVFRALGNLRLARWQTLTLIRNRIILPEAHPGENVDPQRAESTASVEPGPFNQQPVAHSGSTPQADAHDPVQAHHVLQKDTKSYQGHSDTSTNHGAPELEPASAIEDRKLSFQSLVQISLPLGSYRRFADLLHETSEDRQFWKQECRYDLCMPLNLATMKARDRQSMDEAISRFRACVDTIYRERDAGTPMEIKELRRTPPLDPDHERKASSRSVAAERDILSPDAADYTMHVKAPQEIQSSGDQLAQDLKSLLRKLTHPVVIITASHRPQDQIQDLLSIESKLACCRGVTVSSFGAVTLDPVPSVSFNLKIDSRTWAALAQSRYFCAHILSNTSEAASLAHTFTKPYDDSGEPFRILLDRGVYIRINSREIFRRKPPRLHGPAVLAHMFASVDRDKCVEVGDHILVVATVLQVSFNDRLVEDRQAFEEMPGLAYAMRGYRNMGSAIEPAPALKRGSLSDLAQAGDETSSAAFPMPLSTNEDRVEADHIVSGGIEAGPQPHAAAHFDVPQDSWSQHELSKPGANVIKATSAKNEQSIGAREYDGQSDGTGTQPTSGTSSSQAPDLSEEQMHSLMANFSEHLGEVDEAENSSSWSTSETEERFDTAEKSVDTQNGLHDINNENVRETPRTSHRDVPGILERSYPTSQSRPQIKPSPLRAYSTTTQQIRCYSEIGDRLSADSPADGETTQDMDHQTKSPQSLVSDLNLLDMSVAEFLGMHNIPGKRPFKPPMRNMLRLRKEAEEASKRLEGALADGTLTAEESARLEDVIAHMERRIARKVAMNSARDLRMTLDTGQIPNDRRIQWLESSIEKGLAVLLEEAKSLRTGFDSGKIDPESFESAKAMLSKEHMVLNTEVMRLRQIVDEEGDEGGAISNDADDANQNKGFDGFRGNV
jgi:flavin reductase (DIM6/NTAB) family NADH-FMN oxidoreductase RutF